MLDPVLERYYRNNLQSIWRGMKKRCYNIDRPEYHRYGGRGIYICDEWLNDSETFKNWALTHGWLPGLHIDRINNDGPYSPDNCRCVTPKENCNNRSNSIRVTIGGITDTVSNHAEKLNIPSSTLYGRIKEGWSEEEYSLPLRTRIEYEFGERFPGTYLAFVDEIPPIHGTNRRARFRCLYKNCTNFVEIDIQDVRGATTKSCGCYREDVCRNLPRQKTEFEPGYIFEGTYFMFLEDRPYRKKERYVLCKCIFENCENIVEVSLRDIRNGDTKSCGCYGSWRNLVRPISRQLFNDYPDYWDNRSGMY